MVRTVSRNSSDSVARLGLWPATALVVGHTIAVGIFVTPAELIGALASPALVIALWAVFGVLVFCGALSFGELASRHPEAGGPYIFLREAWGERLAFLYGWQCLLVMDPGVIAALTAGLGEYLGAAWPATASYSRWLAIAILWALAAVNAAGLGVSSRLMSRLTALKLASLGGIVGLAFAVGDGTWENLRPFVTRRAGSLPIGEALALGSVAAFFSFGGFWEASRVGGEVRDPQRTLPRALAIGVALVATVYLVTSVAFMYLVPPEQVTSAGIFASLAGERLFGPSGGRVLATIVVLSIVASMMGLLLMAPRVYYAMSRDGLFPTAIARLHPRRGVPDRATLLLAAVATVYASIGTFQQIVSFFICTALAFVALAVAGIVVFRRRATAPTPFQTPGYPITPALFIALVTGIILLVLMARPIQALAGFALVLCGIPAHFLSRRKRS
jgi:APA family basic amino acid/polyamine antiporter